MSFRGITTKQKSNTWVIPKDYNRTKNGTTHGSFPTKWGLVVLLEFFAFFVLRTLGAFYVPYIFCIPCALSYLQPFLSGAKIGQAQFGRPKLQHVAGYAGISTNQRILPKSPLLKVLGVLRPFSPRRV